jgi:hypothetical protein
MGLKSKISDFQPGTQALALNPRRRGLPQRCGTQPIDSLQSAIPNMPVM